MPCSETWIINLGQWEQLKTFQEGKDSDSFAEYRFEDPV